MKKIGLLVLVFFSLFILSGCNRAGKLKNVEVIKKQDIFNQKEDSYFVYFQRIDCPDCEAANPYVIQYATILKEKDACVDKRKVYTVVLYTQNDKPKDENIIYREYTGTDGEGTDGKYKVTGVTDWKDLHIATTSSLIAINTQRDGTKVASYAAQGANNVVNFLFDHLGECPAN